MPLFDFACPTHGKFEAYRRGAAQSAPCPSCGTDAEKVFALTHLAPADKPYDQQVDGHFPNAHKPKVIDRAGGGKAAQTHTGGYRPMVTHSTICPSESKWRNVAVLGQYPYGKRLNCEACGYVWIYNGANTDRPLHNEVREEYRPARRIFMDSSVSLHSGYIAPERGD